MDLKKKILIGIGFLILIVLTLGIVFNSLIPFSFDRTTYNRGYELSPAFPNLEFGNLVDLTNDGNSNSLYAVVQTGVIYKFQNSEDVSQTEIFLDLTDQVACCGERGLLGLAFDPDYQTNGYFYIDYVAPDPLRTVISRFTVVNDAVDVNSELEIISVNQPYSNHNAGSIKFGPDGMLYVTLGDGGSAGDPQGNGQNLGTLLGSILRLNVSQASTISPYEIPEDNPFVNNQGAKGEIWAYGLRNPWKISFDATTGDLWTGDVGQNEYEEVDLIEKGGNYGWNIMEATHCYEPDENCDRSGLILPVAEYDRDEGKSISGGYVYRGSELPDLYGKYIYADYITSRFWYLNADTPGDPEVTDFMKYNMYISGFGVDLDNELYILEYDTDGEGLIYSIIPQS